MYYQFTREVARRKRSEERLVRSNRLYAVLSQVNQAIVRVRERGSHTSRNCAALQSSTGATGWLGWELRGRGGRPEGGGGRWGSPANRPSGSMRFGKCRPGGGGSSCNNLADADMPIALAGGSPGSRIRLRRGVPHRGAEARRLLFSSCAHRKPAPSTTRTSNLLDEVVSDVGFALESPRAGSRIKASGGENAVSVRILSGAWRSGRRSLRCQPGVGARTGKWSAKRLKS